MKVILVVNRLVLLRCFHYFLGFVRLRCYLNLLNLHQRTHYCFVLILVIVRYLGWSCCHHHHRHCDLIFYPSYHYHNDHRHHYHFLHFVVLLRCFHYFLGFVRLRCYLIISSHHLRLRYCFDWKIVIGQYLGWRVAAIIVIVATTALLS